MTTKIESQSDNPNERYSPTNLGTWSSISDVDQFFNRFNHDNGYKDGSTKLSVGNYVTIRDGTYNVDWVIAGFDMEHNQTAADGTVYDNGYGICMIPKTIVETSYWNDTDSVSGGYASSKIHNTNLSQITINLKNVLGTHAINRNVLLSSSVDANNNCSNAYDWMTSYATLMSVSQIKPGSIGSYNNKYDDGEANRMLPLFIYTDYADTESSANFWTRSIYGNYANWPSAWSVYNGKISNSMYVSGMYSRIGVRPLIYLR